MTLVTCVGSGLGIEVQCHVNFSLEASDSAMPRERSEQSLRTMQDL